MLTVTLCGVVGNLQSHSLHRMILGENTAGLTLSKKQFLDFSLLSAGCWSYREWASLVGFRHPVTALHALFSSVFSFWA